VLTPPPMARSFLLSILLVLGLATVAACGDDDRGGGGGGTDSGPIRDGGRQPDGGPLPEDAGPTDDDAGPIEDAGPIADSGPAEDAGPAPDAGPTCPENDLGMAEGDAVAMGTTAGAGDDLGAECVDPGGEDIAYLWTAPRAGSFIFDTNGSTADTALHVHRATCTGELVACDDDGGGPDYASRVATDVTAGEVFVIVVDSYDATTSGDFVLNITEGPATEIGACSGGMDEDRDGNADCDDEDCTADLACIATPMPVAGQLAITEVMNDPMAIADGMGEYFEIYNTGATAFDINGCTIRDGGGMHVITMPVTVGPGAYAVLANSATPGFTPAYVYSGVTFNNTGSDSVTVECGGAVIDTVAYAVGTWPTAMGAAMQLNPTLVGPTASTTNDIATNWCTTPMGTTFGSGDRGTPGAANVACM
jgi:hypothetical protein